MTRLQPELKEPIHFSEALEILRRAFETKTCVTLKAYKVGKKGDADSGVIVTYDSWKVSSNYYKGGYIRLMNPINSQIRLIPEICIVEILGHKIFL